MFENLNVFLMRVPAFFIGAMIAPWIESEKKLGKRTLDYGMTVLLVIGCFMQGILCIKKLHYSAMARLSYCLLAVPACYFISLVQKDGFARKALEFLGKYSLEFYLIHMKCTGIMMNLVGKCGLIVVNVLSAVTTPVLCVATNRIATIVSRIVQNSIEWRNNNND